MVKLAQQRERLARIVQQMMIDILAARDSSAQGAEKTADSEDIPADIELNQLGQDDVVSISSGEDDFDGISVQSSDTDSSCELLNDS
eukprot:9842488-Karenia_brevis.AAC.1